jgi:hypothetical protein
MGMSVFEQATPYHGAFLFLIKATVTIATCLAAE